MIGIDLLRPGLAWVPLCAALVLAVGVVGLRRRRAALAALSGARLRASFAPRAAPGRAALRLALACAGLFLAGLGLLGPVRGYTTRPIVRRGLDLVLCLDTSRSMLAQDLQPSRLERAKREVRGLLEHLRGDRCALLAFSGDAREVAPLTHDRGTLEALLASITTEDNRRGGTDLAAALQQALDLFDGRTGAHEAICLLTDGEDLEGQAARLAEQARERGIRVFVVGVGTEAGGKIPIVGADGRPGFLKGPDGQEVVTRLAGESLRAIAEATGGAYLSVEMSPTPLEEIYEARIATLEGRERETADRRVPHDRYQWALLAAVACMLGESGLCERRRGERAA